MDAVCQKEKENYFQRSQKNEALKGITFACFPSDFDPREKQ